MGCNQKESLPGIYPFSVTSPLLDRSSAPLSGPRSLTEIQLIKAYPQGLWLREIRIHCEPPSALERIEVSFLNGDRHYQKLGIESGPPTFYRANSAQGFELPKNQGIPLRSNEPLLLELYWKKLDPYAQPFRAKCDLEFQWASAEVANIEAVRPSESDEVGELKYVLDSGFKAWPDTLR